MEKMIGEGKEVIKKILNENAEPCHQHKICFKQDIGTIISE